MLHPLSMSVVRLSSTCLFVRTRPIFTSYRRPNLTTKPNYIFRNSISYVVTSSEAVVARQFSFVMAYLFVIFPLDAVLLIFPLVRLKLIALGPASTPFMSHTVTLPFATLLPPFLIPHLQLCWVGISTRVTQILVTQLKTTTVGNLNGAKELII